MQLPDMRSACAFVLPLYMLVVGGGARNVARRIRGAPAPAPAPEPEKVAPPEEIAAWIPVEDEVDEAMTDTRQDVASVKEQLAHLKKHCDCKRYVKCNQRIEMMSARLARLLAAEKQLGDKEEAADKIEDGAQKSAESVLELEEQVSSLHAVKKFAELSKQDVDSQAKHLAEQSEEYSRKMEEAGHRITELRQELERAREERAAAEKRSLDFIAEAKGVERGVNTTDLYAESEFANAVKKQQIAEDLYNRADAIRAHAEKMMVLHHDENRTEVKRVMYGTANRMLKSDQDIDSWGRMSDFGGRLPDSGAKLSGKSARKDKDREPESPAKAAEEEIEAASPDTSDNSDVMTEETAGFQKQRPTWLGSDDSSDDANAPAESDEAEEDASSQKDDADKSERKKQKEKTKEKEKPVTAGDTSVKVTDMSNARGPEDNTWVALPKNKAETEGPPRPKYYLAPKMLNAGKLSADRVMKTPASEVNGPISADHIKPPAQQAVAKVPTTTTATTTTVATTTVHTVSTSTPAGVEHTAAVADENEADEILETEDEGAQEEEDDADEAAEAEVNENSATMADAEKQFEEAERAERQLAAH